MARLKIATFNINGVRARHAALLEWLERERPDVACLQELKAPDEAFPQSDVERLGYGALWHGQKSWNGVAILARGAQPEERRRGLPGDPDESQSRYLEADVHGLRIACLYLPNGNPWPGPKFDYKLAWFAKLRKHAASLLRDGVPTVMCGDFNVVPTDELDIYNARSWRTDALLQPESREAWFELLGQGWTDAIRAVHGDAKVYTFWDYFRKHWERDAGLRIDHLLLSPELAPMLRDAGVDRWVRGKAGASDHAPTWVLLDTDATGARGAAGGRSVATKRANKRVAGEAAADATGGAPKPRASAGTPAVRKKGDAVRAGKAAKKSVATRKSATSERAAGQAPPAARARRARDVPAKKVAAGARAAVKKAGAAGRTTAAGTDAAAKRASADTRAGGARKTAAVRKQATRAARPASKRTTRR